MRFLLKNSKIKIIRTPRWGGLKSPGEGKITTVVVIWMALIR